MAKQKTKPPERLEELMDIPTAAKKLGGVSVFAVKAWIHQGRIRKTKVGNRTMVSAQALRDFLAQCNNGQ